MGKSSIKQRGRAGAPAAEATVFLIEDDDAQCQLISVLLESMGFRVCAYQSAEAFLERYDPWQPGCLVSDVVMPGLNGLNMQLQMRERGIDIPVIFVTAHGDVPMVREALKNGAVDFLEKPLSAVELLESVQRALACDDARRRQQREAMTITAQFDCLTEREREILELLVAGQSNKAVAAGLGISPRTVETHRNNIFKKLRVRSLPELLGKLLSASAS